MATTALAYTWKCLGGKDMQSKNILQQTDKDKVIIQITDTHLMDKPDAKFVGINPGKTFMPLWKMFSSAFQMLIWFYILGIWPKQLIRKPMHYLNYMRGFGIDFYHIPGNHDNLSLSPFMYLNQNPQWLSLINGALFCLTVQWVGVQMEKIQPEQLVRLKQRLKQLRDKFVIVPVITILLRMHSKWLDQHKLKNADN